MNTIIGRKKSEEQRGGRTFGNGIDQMVIEEDGFQAFEGSAIPWEDIDFRIETRTPIAGQPTPANLIGNLNAPQWDVDDYFDCQGSELIHRWLEGSEVHWHLHMYAKGDATDKYVNWQVEYTWANVSEIGTEVPATVTITSGDILIPADATGKLKLLIVQLGSFIPEGGKIAAHVKPRLTRIASSGAAPTNDPFCEMLQLHIRCDTGGSREMTTK